MENFLHVSPSDLTDTGAKYAEIASQIRWMFNNVINSIDAITSNDCWQGDS